MNLIFLNMCSLFLSLNKDFLYYNYFSIILKLIYIINILNNVFNLVMALTGATVQLNTMRSLKNE